MVEKKRLKLVGNFVRQRREFMGLSQKALGDAFNPPVSTQFISNVERGVTPLPPVHIPVIAKTLRIGEVEIVDLLAREYSNRLTGRGGKSSQAGHDGGSPPTVHVMRSDYEFMKNLYEAYKVADPKTKEAFGTVCESILRLSRYHLL